MINPEYRPSVEREPVGSMNPVKSSSIIKTIACRVLDLLSLIWEKIKTGVTRLFSRKIQRSTEQPSLQKTIQTTARVVQPIIMPETQPIIDPSLLPEPPRSFVQPSYQLQPTPESIDLMLLPEPTRPIVQPPYQPQPIVQLATPVQPTSVIVNTPPQSQPAPVSIPIPVPVTAVIHPPVQPADDSHASLRDRFKNIITCSDEILDPIIKNAVGTVTEASTDAEIEEVLSNIQAAVVRLLQKWPRHIDLSMARGPVCLSNLLKFSYWIQDRIAIRFAKNLSKLPQASELTSQVKASPNKIKYLEEWIKANQHNILNLKLSGIKVLPQCIGEFTSLTTLNLSGNELDSLPESFGKLTNLTVVNLSDNLLTNLPKSFGNLTALKGCNLSNNQLSSPSIDFGNLRALQLLNLSRNRFQSFMPSLNKLEELVILDFSDNQISYIPDLTGLGKLKNLQLNNNQLTRASFPGTLPFSNLDNLNLSYNQFTDLPDCINSLANLKGLNLIGNHLTVLPDGICSLSNLKELVLSNNKLTGLPANIGNLSNLDKLLLSDNQLIGLPDSIGNLSNLQELSLSNNLLTGLPDSIGNLSKLTYLNLRNNGFQTNLPLSLKNLIALNSIYINHDQVHFIQDRIQDPVYKINPVNY